MNAAERLALIEQYEAGYQAIADALAGISAAEWEAREAPGEWSPREIVHHLADSEMTAAVRVRLIVAEDNPTLVGYDQDVLVANLDSQRPVEPSLAAFGAARAATAPILRLLTEDQWQRAGTHTAVGRYTVEDWLQTYAPHAHEHADQIRRVRAAVGRQA